MSREILFRGKVEIYAPYSPILIDEWAEGYHYRRGGNNIIYDSDRDIEYIVDPATVGQHVFLEDTKDKKIFTGDILKDQDREGIYVIDFIGGGFGLFTMKEYLDLKHRHTVILWDGLSEPQTACFVTQNLEVIGNIHDNPELVGEKSE